MKYFKSTIYFVPAIVIIFIMGCNNEFLERYPLTAISEATFWNTENDIRVYNNSIYDFSRTTGSINIDNGNNTNNRWFMDSWTDNLVHPTDRYHREKNRIRSGKFQVQSGPRSHGYSNWRLVREINYGLENYYKVDLPKETINQYAAEARFFRAWFYGDKVQFFGNVPWIGSTLNIDSELLYADRMPREQAMDSVLLDINFAVENLPERWASAPLTASTGRFNKWHALLIKSRLCLFEGTFRKYHGGSNPDMWLNEAAKAAGQIIEEGPYEIYSSGNPLDDYRTLQSEILDLNGNSEIMYWREYEAGTVTNSVLTYFPFEAGATKDFVDDYLCTDGNPVITKELGINDLYKGDKRIEDVFENRDPRMRQTILHPEDGEKYRYNRYNSQLPFPQLFGMSGYLTTPSGYHILKYWNRSQYDLELQAQLPAIIMRYAEVLLNFAEAKAELGTLSQADLDKSINLLRDRVAMPHLQLNNVPDDPRYEDVSPLITEIRRERRIELFAEGFRYLDLLRWKQAENELVKPDMGIRWDDEARNRYTDAQVESSVIQDPVTGEMVEYIDVYKGTEHANPVFDPNKHYLWPIPLNAISQNDNLEQNPGW